MKQLRITPSYFSGQDELYGLRIGITYLSRISGIGSLAAVGSLAASY